MAVTSNLLRKHALSWPGNLRKGNLNTLRQFTTSKRSSRSLLKIRTEAAADDDMDVAVFRFTLGIKGFDDSLIPRFVGTVCATLLAINHLTAPPPFSQSQAVAELIGGVLALLCIAAPEIEVRLKEAQPGRGRAKLAEKIQGATNAFAISSSCSEMVKQELAWASFALLRNTNACGVVLISGDKALLARGALGSETVKGDADATLEAVGQDLSQRLKSGALSAGSTSEMWLAERSAIESAGLSAGGVVPLGAECALLTPIDSGATAVPACLLLFSERPRSISSRERQWVNVIAKKLALAV